MQGTSNIKVNKFKNKNLFVNTNNFLNTKNSIQNFQKDKGDNQYYLLKEMESSAQTNKKKNSYLKYKKLEFVVIEPIVKIVNIRLHKN